MHFMQIESVLQTKNRSEQAKNQFTIALVNTIKILKIQTPETFAVVTLKFEQGGFTKGADGIANSFRFGLISVLRPSVT